MLVTRNREERASADYTLGGRSGELATRQLDLNTTAMLPYRTLFFSYKNSALRHDLRMERLALFESPLQGLWRAHDDVDGERRQLNWLVAEFLT
jgi:hypothetical protein